MALPDSAQIQKQKQKKFEKQVGNFARLSAGKKETLKAQPKSDG